MIKSYLKVAFRNLGKNKLFSLINIGGLAIGMATALFIGLWIYDELSFEKYHTNYNCIGQVEYNAHIGGEITTDATLPLPLSAQLKSSYGAMFQQVAATNSGEQSISYGDKAFYKTGTYAEADFVRIITLDMVKGNAASLKSPTSILLKQSLAKTMFGDEDPIGKAIKLNSEYTLQVTGVYKDMPANTRFATLNFIAPLALLFDNHAAADNWYSSSFQIYTLLGPNVSMQQASAAIKNVFYDHTKDATKPELLVNAMSNWHLYDYKNGAPVAGRLRFVWLFGLIGAFVLLLACINFMNLSTARSEKRAKEVGIRKAIGSVRRQLIQQFFTESLLVVFLSFIVSLALVWIALPLFNTVSGKQIDIPWGNPGLWLAALAFCLFTGIVSGSYPAIYLSSFRPVKVLKGTFKAGRFAAVPRKVLIVVQFTVSIILVIGTLVVFNQIQFAKNRPVGYSRARLLSIPYNVPEAQVNSFKTALLNTNAVTGVSRSSNPTTGIWSSADNLDWKGKDPNRQELFGTVLVDPEFGGVVGWQIKEGRNFSKQNLSDSSCFLFNEAAIKQMGLKNPIGETVKWHGKNWTIIGVVKDMVMTSPFDPITPVVFLMDNSQRNFNVINMSINAGMPMAAALQKVEAVYKQFAPGSPFNYKFADDEYAVKFAAEERIGTLSLVFSALAIFISCFGLFGLASFVAEQRTKEIGVRKVLGASVMSIWQLISKEFVVLVVIALLVATPVSYYFMQKWLLGYQYHTAISWWIFAATASGALFITLATVSYQGIKAATASLVKSLRAE